MTNVQTLRQLVGASLISIVCGLTLTANAGAPNTTAANSVPYEVGQGWVTHYFDEATQTRWFKYGEVGGHSYCIEAVQGSVSPIQLDPNLAVFTDATGVTALTISGAALTNNDGDGNPNFVKGSRICYISPNATFGASAIRSVKLNVPVASGSGDAGFIKFRIVETTLSHMQEWSYLSGQLRNFASTATSFKLTFVPKDGSTPWSLEESIPPYQQVTKNQQIPPIVIVDGNYVFRYGLFYIAHTATPGRLGAQMGTVYFHPLK